MTLTVDWERMSLCPLNTFPPQREESGLGFGGDRHEDSSVGLLREQQRSKRGTFIYSPETTGYSVPQENLGAALYMVVCWRSGTLPSGYLGLNAVFL